eukprot:SAG31_NODE_1313_length_8853_cov_60.435458_3_plen_141_part_00
MNKIPILGPIIGNPLEARVEGRRWRFFTFLERETPQTDRDNKKAMARQRAGGRVGAAKLVSRARVPDDAPPAPAPSHNMSWAPTSTQQPTDTSTPQGVKASASTPSTLRQRERDTTDRQTDRDNKKRHGEVVGVIHQLKR